jgi:hypothetical protein
VDIGDLKHHLAVYAQPGAHGLIFVGPKGAPIRRNNFASRVWARAAEAAIPDQLSPARPTQLGRHHRRPAWSHHQGAHAPARAGLWPYGLRYQHAEQEREAALAATMSAALRQSEGTALA